MIGYSPTVHPAEWTAVWSRSGPTPHTAAGTRAPGSAAEDNVGEQGPECALTANTMLTISTFHFLHCAHVRPH